MITNGERRPPHAPESGVEAVVLGILNLPDRVARLEKAIGEVRENLGAQRDELDDIRNGIGAVEANVDRATTAIQAMYERLECLNAANEQRSRLTERFFEETVLEPLVRRVFQLIDLLGGADAENTDGEAGASGADVLAATRAELLSLLSGYGVEPVYEEPGCRMDAKLMCPVRTKYTADPRLDLTVAESLRVGFRRGDRVLRPQSVVVFRWAPSSTRIGEGGER